MGNMIKIGMAELNVCLPPDAITTLGLGSCVGVVLYDPVKKVCGMVHVMLPDSTKIKNASGQIIRDGVGNRPLKQFQKIGLPAMLDFAGTNNKIKIEIDREEIITVFNSLSEIIKKVEGWLDEN